MARPSRLGRWECLRNGQFGVLAHRSSKLGGKCAGICKNLHHIVATPQARGHSTSSLWSTVTCINSVALSRLAEVQGSTAPCADQVHCLVAAADHGIAATHAVSAFPSSGMLPPLSLNSAPGKGQSRNRDSAIPACAVSTAPCCVLQRTIATIKGV